MKACCKKGRYAYVVEAFAMTGCDTCGPEVRQELNRYCATCRDFLGMREMDCSDFTTGDELWDKQISDVRGLPK